MYTTLPVSPQVPLGHHAKYHVLCRTTSTHCQSALLLCKTDRNTHAEKCEKARHQPLHMPVSEQRQHCRDTPTYTTNFGESDAHNTHTAHSIKRGHINMYVRSCVKTGSTPHNIFRWKYTKIVIWAAMLRTSPNMQFGM